MYEQRDNNRLNERYSLLNSIRRGELDRFVNEGDRAAYNRFLQNTVQPYMEWIGSHLQLGNTRSQTNQIAQALSQVVKSKK
jgi:hypothetical protein